MRILLTILAIGCLLLSVPSESAADVFASGIRLTNPDGSAYDGNPADATPARIQFLLNDTASTVTVRLHRSSDNAVVHTIMMTALSSGWHSTTWDGTGSGGSGSFYVTVEATQAVRSSTAYTVFRFINTRSSTYTIFSRGVDVVRDQANPQYGYIYTANAGGPLKRGICRYTADGWFAGSDSGSPILTPSLSDVDGGVTPWSASVYAPVFATTDKAGRVYVSDNPRGEVWRIDGPAATPKRIISGLTEPKGLAAVGEGANLKIYIAAGKQVLRANIGTQDTLSGIPDLVANLTDQAHDIAFDDGGFMYVNVRGGTGFDGSGSGWTEQYNISGTLPVTSSNKIWSITWPGSPIGLRVSSGPSTSTPDDDILYVSIRGDGVDLAAPGVHEVINLHDAFGLAWKNIFTPNSITSLGSAGGNVSSRADLTLDPVGNILFWENGNEEIIMLAPPRSGATVTQTTRGTVTITVGATSASNEGDVPSSFELGQNYPNPFNPSTQISFRTTVPGPALLKVFDILGREVATLVDGHIEAGSYQVTFQARELRSGTYIYTLQQGGRSVSRKMLLVR